MTCGTVIFSDDLRSRRCSSRNFNFPLSACSLSEEASVAVLIEQCAGGEDGDPFNMVLVTKPRLIVSADEERRWSVSSSLGSSSVSSSSSSGSQIGPMLIGELQRC